MAAITQELINETGLTDFQIAARLTGLHPVILRKLVRDGVLPGVAPYRVAGVVGSCNIERAREIAEKLAEARRPVEGQGISALAATAKYGFSRKNIYQWHERGWVKNISSDPEDKHLFDEGDIAFARALADIVGHKQGKPLLPSKQ